VSGVGSEFESAHRGAALHLAGDLHVGPCFGVKVLHDVKPVRFYTIHDATRRYTMPLSSSLSGPVNPSLRALSGRLKFTVRFMSNEDFLSLGYGG